MRRNASPEFLFDLPSTDSLPIIAIFDSGIANDDN